MRKVYISEPIHEDAIRLLERSFEVVQGGGAADIAGRAYGCEAILVRVARITEEIMDALPGLRVIAKHGIGVDNIDVQAATARGILVVNAPTANIHAVAEHTATLIMALLKNLVFLDAMTRNGGFEKRNQHIVTELRGKKVGFIGFGRIARLVRQKLSGFEASFLAADPFMEPEQAEAFGVTPVDMEKLLEQADVISLHTPLTPETHHLIDRNALERMKRSAFLINAARGAVVDEQALVEALQARRIAGAALDVFEEEPPAENCPLWGLDNLIVSPHNAALSDAAMRAMGMDSAQGILDCLEDRRPAYMVNAEVWHCGKTRREV